MQLFSNIVKLKNHLFSNSWIISGWVQTILAPLIHSTELLWRLIRRFTYLLTYLQRKVDKTQLTNIIRCLTYFICGMVGRIFWRKPSQRPFVIKCLQAADHSCLPLSIWVLNLATQILLQLWLNYVRLWTSGDTVDNQYIKTTSTLKRFRTSRATNLFTCIHKRSTSSFAVYSRLTHRQHAEGCLISNNDATN